MNRKALALSLGCSPATLKRYVREVKRARGRDDRYNLTPEDIAWIRRAIRARHVDSIRLGLAATLAA